jgi:hypothetical protein
MDFWTVIGLAILFLIVASILISYYFKKKEEYHVRLEGKVERKDETGGGR